MELTSSLRALYAPGVAYEIATPDRTIPDMVAEVAARYPSRAAIDFFARPLTYSQLVADMRRCAGALRQAGVRPGDRVALVIPNCPQHAVAVLGTMLLGAIVVEHNPLAPAEELRGEYGRGARHDRLVEVPRQAHLSRQGAHDLCTGSDDGSARGLALGLAPAAQGGPREARHALEPAPAVGAFLGPRPARGHPVGGFLPRRRRRRRAPHPHGRNDRRA